MKTYPKTECTEMYNSVRKHLGVTVLRQKHYSLYNYWTSKKGDYLTEKMYGRLVDLYDNITPTMKKEVPFDINEKYKELEVLNIYKESFDFTKLSSLHRNKIDYRIHRLKEMIN